MAKTEKQQRNNRGTNPNSIANLKPFQKGESGNPLGNHTGTKHRHSQLRKWVDLQVKFSNTNKRGEKVFEQLEQNIQITVEDEIDLAAIAEARKGNMAAYREIKDALYGKQTDKVEVTDNARTEQFYLDLIYKLATDHKTAAEDIFRRAVETDRIPREFVEGIEVKLLGKYCVKNC